MTKVDFDKAPHELVRICEADPGFQRWVHKACWVRDLRGRVRLVIDPIPQAGDLDQLQAKLAQSLDLELGPYFVGPVLATTDKREQGAVAKSILVEGQEVESLEFVTPLGPGEAQKKWLCLERRLAKQEWLNKIGAAPVWPLKTQTPLVATFYSFKGGVGRTTALVACALHGARAGKKVAVVDLDLEAPGLGSLLEIENPRKGGVLDAIVEHLATGSLDLNDRYAAAPTRALTNEGEAPQGKGEIVVFPAGSLNRAYIEKLARLDFVGSTSRPESDSPVKAALEALLTKIRSVCAPDLILIDARAGLHDLAGLSLHGLAHVDVILSRASSQAYAGLELTIQTLKRPKAADQAADDSQPIIVHNFAPADPYSPEYLREIAEFRSEVYKFFSENFYGKGAPSEDSDGPHSPVVLPYEGRLVRFTALASVEKLLLSDDFKKLWDKLVEKGKPL